MSFHPVRYREAWNLWPRTAWNHIAQFSQSKIEGCMIKRTVCSKCQCTHDMSWFYARYSMLRRRIHQADGNAVRSKQSGACQRFTQSGAWGTGYIPVFWFRSAKLTWDIPERFLFWNYSSDFFIDHNPRDLFFDQEPENCLKIMNQGTNDQLTNDYYLTRNQRTLWAISN